MRLLLLAVMVLAFASQAQAAPEGFRDSTRLSSIATEIVGKPVVVSCARTKDAWVGFSNLQGIPGGAARGFADQPDGVAYLTVNVCRALEGWLRGKNAPTILTLGSEALTLVHETMHLRGISNEHAADCAALAELPRVLRIHFRVKSARLLSLAMRSAKAEHDSAPAAYTGAC